MDFQSWINNVSGLAGIYSFDIMPDGSYSEIRLMAVNKQNEGVLFRTPNAPKFYPGIPYRNYWQDINFEDFVYRCGVSNQPMYSYVNAHGFWLKGHYIPITEPGTVSADVSAQQDDTKPRTVHCLYIITYSQQVESDSMTKRSSEATEAVMNISVKLHETQDFEQAMAATTGEIKKLCGTELCSLYIVDQNTQRCDLINENGMNRQALENLVNSIGRSPYETAVEWEKDLAESDCLLLENLDVIKQRDPAWYASLTAYGVTSLVLYAVRFNQTLVGFIWVCNFDTSKILQIKETLELTSFLIAAVIANHQLVSGLEVKSTIDGLTQVSNRNAMNNRVDKLVSGETKLPEKMGVAFADLNGLKTVNDDQGHDAGDLLLKRAAALLKIVFGEDEVYRAGGDEFVIFSPNTAEDRFCEKITQLRGLADNTSDVSFAVGSVYCTGNYDICKAMQQADEKMYNDKEEYYRLHPEKDRRKRSRG